MSTETQGFPYGRYFLYLSFLILASALLYLVHLRVDSSVQGIVSIILLFFLVMLRGSKRLPIVRVFLLLLVALSSCAIFYGVSIILCHTRIS